MSNVLEYILNLKDGISDKINKISATSEKATSKMQKLEKQTLDNTKAFDKAGKSAEGFKSKISNALSAIPGADFLTNPYVLAATAIGVAGKASMSFDEGMAKINTTAQLTKPQLQGLEDQLTSFGMKGLGDVNKLPEAYEKILSQTGDVSLSMDILEKSLYGAKAGFTDQNTVAGALAQTLSIVGKEKTNAQEVLDTFLMAKKVGAGEFQDFATYMPNLIASGSALGIAYKDVAGQFAYMTGKGFAAEKSATLLENAYTALGKSDIQKGLKNAGVNIFDEKGAMRSFDKIFPELQKKLAGMSDNKKSNFLESIGLKDAQAKSAFMALSSDSAKLKEALDETNNSWGELQRQYALSENPMQKIEILWYKIKAVGKVLGDVISVVLTPALDGLNFIVDSGINFFKDWKDGLAEGNVIIWGVTAAIGALSIGMAIAWMWTKKAIVEQKIKAAWDTTVAFTTGGWASAQTLLNGTLLANPVTWVVAGIIALIAVIGYVVYKTDGWGKAWKHTVNGAKLLWQTYVSYVKAQWDTLVNGLMIGINKVQVGWYKFKNAVGLGDENANNSIINQLNEDTENRKEQITKSWGEVKKNGLGAAAEFMQAGKSLKWNDKSLGDMVGGLKKKISLPSGGGIAPPTIPGANLDNSPIGGDGKGGKGSKSKVNESIATGGQKHNYITINLKDLIGVLNISGKDFKDSSNQMQQQTEDALMRVLAMATTAGI